MRLRPVANAALGLALVCGACSSSVDAAVDAGTAAGGGVLAAAPDAALPGPGSVAPAGPSPAAPKTDSAGGGKNGTNTAPGGQPAKPAAPKAQATTPTTTSTPQGATGSPGFPLKVTISPMCVEPGKKLLVTVETRPHASIGAAIGYSDNQAHGALTIGSAAPDGVWRWDLVVSPEAPPGPARVLISAQDRTPGSGPDGGGTNGEGAKGTFPFEVRSKC